MFLVSEVFGLFWKFKIREVDNVISKFLKGNKYVFCIEVKEIV